MAEEGSNNIMDTTEGESAPALQTVVEVRNADDQLVGYQCEATMSKNKPKHIDITLYMDVKSPAGEQEAAIAYIQQQVVEEVAAAFEIKSGVICGSPPLGKGSWLLQFVADPSNIELEDFFDKCSKLEPQPEVEECAVYRMMVTGSVPGNPTRLKDLESVLTKLLDSSELTDSQPYQTAFLGIPEPANAGNDSARDNLSPPSSLKEEQTASPKPENTITIVGGLLVAAFCCAFLGILLIVWRRRRMYLKEQDHPSLTLSKSDLEQYDTDDIQGGDGTSEPQPPALPLGASSNPHVTEEEAFPNNITFDLGTSFKDQLMGVHGTSSNPHASGGVPAHMMPQHRGAYAHSVASDSDADSWAQTDGTIGSLELQLEPITAEV